MKRRIKLAISLAVRAWDILHDTACRLVGRQLPPRCMVLYYHAIPARHRALFARQLDTILKLASPISTNPNGSLTPGARYVSITFDDGFASVLENAAPELKKRKIPWTLFVPSGCLGQQPAWLRDANGAARQDRVLTAEELRHLASDPLVMIGSHTVAHPNLLEVGPDRAAAELGNSKADLEAAIGKPVRQLSYPFGARSPAIDQQARQLGYQRLFSSEPVYAFRSGDEPVTGRASVDPDTSWLEFRLKLLGAYRWQAVVGRR